MQPFFLVPCIFFKLPSKEAPLKLKCDYIVFCKAPHWLKLAGLAKQMHG